MERGFGTFITGYTVSLGILYYSGGQGWIPAGATFTTGLLGGGIQSYTGLRACMRTLNNCLEDNGCEESGGGLDDGTIDTEDIPNDEERDDEGDGGTNDCGC